MDTLKEPNKEYVNVRVKTKKELIKYYRDWFDVFKIAKEQGHIAPDEEFTITFDDFLKEGEWYEID